MDVDKGAGCAQRQLDISLDLRASALFFDFDGTLTPIVDRPDAVNVPETVRQLLQRLSGECGGALAIVSGRGIDDIDRFLAPLRLPIAGLHGAQWRGPDGQHQEIELDTAPLVELAARMDAYAATHPGVLIERKRLSLAVHYRLAPEYETELKQILQNAMTDPTSAYMLQPGKMVLELKPRAASKAIAIRRFLAQAPFQGRIPLFAGDDLTDEPGFEAINKLGGHSIKIGPGPSCALIRTASTETFLQWLTALP